MEKKGDISIQFNWIFVLIVGAIILLFFGNIIRTQQKLSSSKISATVLNDIDAISSGAEVSRGTVQVINIPDLDLGFSCSETCACTYYLGDTRVEFGDKIIFAPELIQGRQITAWTYDWSMPYRVSNMLYMTSPGMRYILLDDGLLMKELNLSLPPKIMIIEDNEEIIFNKELIPKSQFQSIKGTNNYKVKVIGTESSFVPVDDVPLALQKMGDKDVSALKIKGNAEKGELIFFSKKGNNWVAGDTTYYIGESMLYAAIFAEDGEMYRCGVEKLFEKMVYVTSVYTNRTMFLNNHYTASRCPLQYQDALRLLKDQNSGIRPVVEDVLRNGISGARFNSLYTRAHNLDDLNKVLPIVDDCQELY